MKNKFNGSRWWRFLYFLLHVVLYVSCSHSPRNHTTDAGKNDYKDTLQRKPPSSFSDTIKINFPAAVFYNPDSLQLEKIRSVTDVRIFDGSMHEYFYLKRNARSVIKEYIPRLKIIEAKNVRYFLFVRADNSTDCIDLNTKNDAYGLFVFNRKKPPSLLDMANIESELGVYFSK